MIAKLRRGTLLIRPYFTVRPIRKGFRLLAPFVIPHWRAYLGLLCCMGIDIFLTMGFAWFLGGMTDAAVQSDAGRMKKLAAVGACFVGLSLLTAYFSEYFQTAATHSVKRDLKAKLYEHILLLPARSLADQPSGSLLAHFTNHIHSIDGVIGSSLLGLIKFPLISIGVFVYLFHISWQLSLLTALVAPLAVLAGAVFGLLMRTTSLRLYKLAEETNQMLSETFWGFTVIRSFTLEKLFYRKFLGQNRELYSLEVRNAKLRGWFFAGGSAVGSMVFLVSLCLGTYFVWKGQITVGSLLSFVNLTNHLIYPLTGLAGLWAGFQRSITGIERLSEVLEQPAETAELPEYSPSPPFRSSIEFRDVCFGYDGGSPVFNRFSLNIPAGGVTAIVGSSGAGKTTMFHLLQGFFKPASGQILVDHVQTERITPAELRSLFAYVPQETFLFDGTIRENLMLARPGITEEELVRAVTAANLHAFILTLPHGFDTEIGERGLKLSGGQKQRLAIARAVLKEAPILLLDEATSALDSETEHQVKEALERVMKARTTLVIAHRLSTIRSADLIVVLDKGVIVQQGSHDELITAEGLYRSLYQKQLLHSLQNGATAIDHPFDTSVV